MILTIYSFNIPYIPYTMTPTLAPRRIEKTAGSFPPQRGYFSAISTPSMPKLTHVLYGSQYYHLVAGVPNIVPLRSKKTMTLHSDPPPDCESVGAQNGAGQGVSRCSLAFARRSKQFRLSQSSPQRGRIPRPLCVPMPPQELCLLVPAKRRQDVQVA